MTGDDASVATVEKGGQSKVKAVRILMKRKYLTCYSDLHGTWFYYETYISSYLQISISEK